MNNSLDELRHQLGFGRSSALASNATTTTTMRASSPTCTPRGARLTVTSSLAAAVVGAVVLAAVAWLPAARAGDLVCTNFFKASFRSLFLVQVLYCRSV